MNYLDVILITNGFNKTDEGYYNDKYYIKLVNNILVTAIDSKVIRTTNSDTMSLFSHINKISKTLQ